MTHKEFHEAVRAIAGSRYFSTKVEASEGGVANVKLHVTFRAYIDGQDWTEEHRDARACIRELVGPSGHDVLDMVGAPPC